MEREKLIGQKHLIIEKMESKCMRNKSILRWDDSFVMRDHSFDL